MCLVFDKKQTTILENKLKQYGYVYLYKVLAYCSNRKTLLSPMRAKMYAAGWNISNRTPASDITTDCSKGIHVFTSRKRAQEYKSPSEVIVKVRCFKKDFVAGGLDSEALFNKIFISKKEFNKALKLAKRKYEYIYS